MISVDPTLRSPGSVSDGTAPAKNASISVEPSNSAAVTSARRTRTSIKSSSNSRQATAKAAATSPCRINWIMVSRVHSSRPVASRDQNLRCPSGNDLARRARTSSLRPYGSDLYEIPLTHGPCRARDGFARRRAAGLSLLKCILRRSVSRPSAPTSHTGSGIRWSLESLITSYHYRGLLNCTISTSGPQCTLLQF
jgi:hypothetical protein